MKRISAGVSNCGPSQAAYTPSPSSSPRPAAASCARGAELRVVCVAHSRGTAARARRRSGRPARGVPCRFTWSR
jgi:hypothetical protein